MTWRQTKTTESASFGEDRDGLEDFLIIEWLCCIDPRKLVVWSIFNTIFLIWRLLRMLLEKHQFYIFTNGGNYIKLQSIFSLFYLDLHIFFAKNNCAFSFGSPLICYRDPVDFSKCSSFDGILPKFFEISFFAFFLPF